MDVYLIPDRQEVMKEVVEYCKANNIKEPTIDDFNYLNHIYDFLISTMEYEEITQEEFDRCFNQDKDIEGSLKV